MCARTAIISRPSACVLLFSMAPCRRLVLLLLVLLLLLLMLLLLRRRWLLLLLLPLRRCRRDRLPKASHHGGVVREEGGIIEGPAASVGKAKVHTTVCTEELLRRREGRVLAQHLARAWGLDAGAVAEVDPAHEGDTVPRVASRLAGERRGRRDHRERLHWAAAGGRRAAEGGRHRVVAQTGHAMHAVHASVKAAGHGTRHSPWHRLRHDDHAGI
mmetsp:Transcript_89781/g.228385  ORF Transcript_89781/g.228385 Transcript_89781/m.228385 type:complete len:215 (+) Transcript_89781:112-756(+)